MNQQQGEYAEHTALAEDLSYVPSAHSRLLTITVVTALFCAPRILAHAPTQTRTQTQTDRQIERYFLKCF